MPNRFMKGTPTSPANIFLNPAFMLKLRMLGLYGLQPGGNFLTQQYAQYRC